MIGKAGKVIGACSKHYKLVFFSSYLHLLATQHNTLSTSFTPITIPHPHHNSTISSTYPPTPHHHSGDSHMITAHVVCSIGVGRGVLGGPEPPPPQYFSRGGQSPLNILGLILRCLVNYKPLPKVLKGFAPCQPPPPNIYAFMCRIRSSLLTRQLITH